MFDLYAPDTLFPPTVKGTIRYMRLRQSEYGAGGRNGLFVFEGKRRESQVVERLRRGEGDEFVVLIQEPASSKEGDRCCNGSEGAAFRLDGSIVDISRCMLISRKLSTKVRTLKWRRTSWSDWKTKARAKSIRHGDSMCNKSKVGCSFLGTSKSAKLSHVNDDNTVIFHSYSFLFIL